MKTVMNHSHDGWLLKMIRRTDPMIYHQKPSRETQRYKKIIKILGGNEKNNYLCIVKCSSRYSRHEKFAIKNVILK